MEAVVRPPARALHLPIAGGMARDWYSVSEAASLLGVSRVTVSRWVRDGRVPATRLGHRTVRIRAADLDAMLVQSRTGRAGAWLGRRGRTEARAGEHIVQFYETEAAVAGAAAEFIGEALRAGQSGLVVATAAHRAAIQERLQASGVAIEAARSRGRYVELDAAATLAQFMVEGEPDAGRVRAAIGESIRRASASGRQLRVYGEMVGLLAAAGNADGAVRLEELWCDLGREHAFTLLCAYPLDALAGPDSKLFDYVCGKHARVIPAESFTELPTLEARQREIARLQRQAKLLEWEIAERQRSEERLLRSERALRDFFENATEGLHWVGPDGRIVWANPAELEMLGYAAEEYVGHHIREFHVDGDAADDVLRRLLAGEALRDYPARLRARDGSIRDILINCTAYCENGEFIHAHCFTRDISDRVRAEEARARLAAIVESSDDAIIGKTLDGVVTSWNSAAERIFGYAADEIVGKPITTIIPLDRRDEEREILARLRSGQRIEHYETVRLRKDGQPIHVSLTISPIRDPRGAIVGASKIARNITDRKLAELEREALLAREREARRDAETALRLRDEFLSIASHELRTPLTTLSAHAQLALRRLAREGGLEPARAESTLLTIRDQAGKLSRLINQLLDVSRLEAGRLTLERQTTDLAALLRRAASDAATWSELHEIAVEAPPRLEAWIDPLRMEQVLSNLLDNAVKYSPDGGRIEVTLGQTGIATELAVRDHGVGVPPDRRDRIFERYYQGQDHGSSGGLGLGLYICRQIIELHGGAIRYEAPDDGGSRFIVRLPVAPAEPSPAADGENVARGGAATGSAWTPARGG